MKNTTHSVLSSKFVSAVLLSTLSSVVLASPLVLSPWVLASDAQAQSTPPSQQNPLLTNEGVVGTQDKYRRSPLLSVQSVPSAEVTKILVDVSMPNDQYAKYPVQVDFFVNRQFVTSQIRSVELPGALGIDIPTATTPRPFNYTIVAKTLHPNREYKSVVQAAVASQHLAMTADCTVSISTISADEVVVSSEFLANDVGIQQTGEQSYSFSFAANAIEGTETVNITLTGVAGNAQTGGFATSASGSLLRNEAVTPLSLTGELLLESGTLNQVELNSADELFSISCQ